MDLLRQLDLPTMSDSSDTDDFLQELAALNDAGLLRATMESLECGRLTPLIKEELRCRIQSRRLSEGKEELFVEFPSPTPSQPRPDEVEKRDRRREQNRRAAQKFRKKKKERGEHLIEETQRLECHNTSLRSEIKQLHEERAQLTRIIQSHASVCPLTPRQSPLTIPRESPLPGSIRESPLPLATASGNLLTKSPVMGKSPVLVQSPALLVPPTRESPVPLLIINPASARESPVSGRVIPSSPVPMCGRPRKSPVSLLRVNQSPIPGEKLGDRSPVPLGSPPKQSKHSIPPRLNLAGPKPVVPILPKPAASSTQNIQSPKTPRAIITSPLPIAPSPVSVGGRALHMSPVFFGEGCFTPSARGRHINQSPISVTDSNSSSTTPARITQQSPVFFGDRAPSTAQTNTSQFLQPSSASSTSSTSSLASLLCRESPSSVLSNNSCISNASTLFASNTSNINKTANNNKQTENNANASINSVNNNDSTAINNNNNKIHFQSFSNFPNNPTSQFSNLQQSSTRENAEDNVLSLEDIERSASGFEAREDFDFIDIQALLELGGDHNGNAAGESDCGLHNNSAGSAQINQGTNAMGGLGLVQNQNCLMGTNSDQSVDTLRSSNNSQHDGAIVNPDLDHRRQVMIPPYSAQNVNSYGNLNCAPNINEVNNMETSDVGQQTSTLGFGSGICHNPNSLSGPSNGQFQNAFNTSHASPFSGHSKSALKSSLREQREVAFQGCGPNMIRTPEISTRRPDDKRDTDLLDYNRCQSKNPLSAANFISLQSRLGELFNAQNAQAEYGDSPYQPPIPNSNILNENRAAKGNNAENTRLTDNDKNLVDNNATYLNNCFVSIGNDVTSSNTDSSDCDLMHLHSSLSLEMLVTSQNMCNTGSDSVFSQTSHQYT